MTSSRAVINKSAAFSEEDMRKKKNSKRKQSDRQKGEVPKDFVPVERYTASEIKAWHARLRKMEEGEKKREKEVMKEQIKALKSLFGIKVKEPLPKRLLKKLKSFRRKKASEKGQEEQSKPRFYKRFRSFEGKKDVEQPSEKASEERIEDIFEPLQVRPNILKAVIEVIEEVELVEEPIDLEDLTEVLGPKIVEEAIEDLDPKSCFGRLVQSIRCRKNMKKIKALVQWLKLQEFCSREQENVLEEWEESLQDREQKLVGLFEREMKVTERERKAEERERKAEKRLKKAEEGRRNAKEQLKEAEELLEKRDNHVANHGCRKTADCQGSREDRSTMPRALGDEK